MLINVKANYLPSKYNSKRASREFIKFENQIFDLALSEKNYSVFKKYLSPFLNEISNKKLYSISSGFVCKIDFKNITIQVVDDVIKVLEVTPSFSRSLSLQATSFDSYIVEEYMYSKEYGKTACITKEDLHKKSIYEVRYVLGNPGWFITNEVLENGIKTIESYCWDEKKLILKK